uniref:Mitochondrial carrier homolog 2 n=1 Tax=Elaeophora elaphi TaxID=1147741 RepID=A0A0R3RWU6_9BILA
MPAWSRHLGLDDAEGKLRYIQDIQAEKVEKRGRYIAVKTLVGAAIYPLTYVKVLFQLGYEPFPLTSGKFLWFFREAYFLPNGFKYGIIFISFRCYLICYMDHHYLEIGGKPINLDKEESEMSDAESMRRVLRFAIRESISRTFAVILSRPFTVIMVRQIAQIVGGELKYHNLLSSLRLVGIEEGPKGLFSGLIPQLIVEYLSIWGIHFLLYGVERITLRAQQDAIRSNNKEEENFVVSTRKMLHLIAPVFVNSFTYPFQVVSTVMAVAGSGLLVSTLPYSPPFTLWQDAYDYLLPVNGLKRGSRIFWREHCGAVSVGSDQELYAANKHFVAQKIDYGIHENRGNLFFFIILLGQSNFLLTMLMDITLICSIKSFLTVSIAMLRIGRSIALNRGNVL